MAEPQFGPVATRALFENDAVKVWEMDLKPGEICGTHRHTMDYVLYILEGGKLAVEGPGIKPFTFAAGTRSVYFVPPGAVENARNIGRTGFHEALFELKRPPRAGTERPGFAMCEALVDQEPRFGVVSILENDRVRIRETTLAPGQETGMSFNSRDAVVYVIEGGELRQVERSTQDGPEQSVEAELGAGSVQWRPRGVYRNAINLGQARYRQVSVELK